MEQAFENFILERFEVSSVEEIEHLVSINYIDRALILEYRNAFFPFARRGIPICCDFMEVRFRGPLHLPSASGSGFRAGWIEYCTNCFSIHSVTDALWRDISRYVNIPRYWWLLV